MKKAIVGVFLFGIALTAMQVLAQEKYEPITVKDAEVTNGVVIVAVQAANTRFELQCNTNTSGCSALQPGSYVMVRLPKNWGTYVCSNVRVYSAQTTPENLVEKLGEYCLIEK
jgi:hypothetical protein